MRRHPRRGGAAAGTPGGDMRERDEVVLASPSPADDTTCADDVLPSPTPLIRGSNKQELVIPRYGLREVTSMEMGGGRQEDYYEEERKDDIATAREVAEERAKQRQIQRAMEREMVAASKEEMGEVLRVMGPLPGRISELLSEVGPGGGARRGLAFMEKELSTIVAALRRISASAAVWPEDIDARIKARLTHLRDLAEWTLDLLGRGHAPREASELPELNLAWIEQLLLVDAHHVGRGHSGEVVVLSPDEPRIPQPHGGGNGAAGTPPRLVGIDGPRKKLLRWLDAPPALEGDTASLRIISITGPAGVGKTTLAMDLHRQTGQYFHCHAATTMSWRPPATRKILKHIMSQFIDSAAPASSSGMAYDAAAILEGDEHELAYDINKYLQDKRYLIVIDDIWRTADWEIIQDAFPSNKHGSRIIITTPITSVAHSFCSQEDGLVHEVKPLGVLDSDRLFLAEAFGSGGCCPSDHLRQVSDEILRRCDGIPLFIIAMAGLIKQEEPEDVNSKTAAYWLERIPELKQVEEALSPSYDDLPYELRLLSLHMSTFPVGYEIDKHRLIRKWKAEGLIAQNMWRTFEEVAEEYFSELLDRDIIRPVTHGYNFSETEACCYQVNHFMIQFLASLSAQHNFLTSWTLKSAVVAAPTEAHTEARMIQRLSLHQPDPELEALLERTDFSHTRSLTVYGAVNQIPLDKFVHLVVLDLEGWENLKDDDMGLICSSQFFLLKYLSIRCTRVSWLPPQIIELLYLETLDISHTQIRELPSQVWELLELQALDLRNTQVKLLPGYVPSRAHGVRRQCLRRLLVNDHEMDKIVTEVPKDIVNWRFLEALETVDLSNCSASFIKNLALLRFLEVLAVKWSFHQCYDEECTSALQSAIHRSGCLKSLTIHCELGCSMEFLDSLPDTSRQSLQNVRIMGRFLTVPKWIKGMNHLVFLEIMVCKLAPDDVNLLGSLKRLAILVLSLGSLPEEEAIVIKSDQGFAELVRLSVDCRLPSLAFTEGSMPKLTNLDLKFSTGPRLASQESWPSGIANLLSLEQVTLRYYPWYINSCSIRVVIDTVRRQIAELGYVVKLVNNGIEEDVEMILAETRGDATVNSLTISANPAKKCNDPSSLEGNASLIIPTRIGSFTFDVRHDMKEDNSNIATAAVELPCKVFVGANFRKKGKPRIGVQIGSNMIYVSNHMIYEG